MSHSIRKLNLVISQIILIIILCCFIIRHDQKNLEASIDQSIDFSAESGFYPDDFELSMSAKGKIHYTLDGTDPQISSPLYSKPLHITDMSNSPNVYSQISEISPAYDMEFMEKYADMSTVKAYSLPEEYVDKCTVVKSAIEDSDGNIGKIYTNVYFVGFNKKEAYNDCSILSIVTDPHNLFDYNDGIYVMGERFDEQLSKGNLSKAWGWWKGNYSIEDDAHTPEARFDFFDEEKNHIDSRDVMIRIHGNTSRNHPMKSLNIYTKSDNGSEYFNQAIMNNSIEASALVLQADKGELSRMRQYVLESTLSDRKFDVLTPRLCALFLDGEYWGLYYLNEKFDEQYISSKYDILPNNIIRVKGAQGKYLSSSARGATDFQACVEYIGNTDMSIESNYNKACKLIDMDNYINYCAAMVYISRNTDWPASNYIAWKSRNKDLFNPYCDNRWRFMLFDLDSAWGVLDDNTIHSLKAGGGSMNNMFDSLCKNAAFRQKFVIEIEDLMNKNLSADNILPIIDDFKNRHTLAVTNFYDRFYDNSISADTFIEETDKISSFFVKRPSYIIEQFTESFNLTGEIGKITLKVNDNAGGYFIINSIIPDLSKEGNWEGQYFIDYPITIRAIPYEGYKLKRWNSNSLSIDDNLIDGSLDKDSITIRPSINGIDLEGIFVSE